MKKLLLFGIIFYCVNAHSQYSWTEKMHYGGAPVYDAFSFVVGSKAYVGNGRDISLTYYTDLWEYDPSSDSWTQMANLPSAGRFASRTFSIGNSGYVVSGYSPTAGFLNELWEYNTVTNAWTQKAPHPGIARYTAIAFALNNKGYFGLGSVFGNNYQNDFYEYDPTLNSWITKPNFPGTARQASSEFVINNEAYVGLGSNVLLSSNYNDFFKYNPISNTWTPIAVFPGTGRNGAFSFSINGEGFILLGYDYFQSWPSNVFHDFWKYNPGSNSWTQLPDFPDTARYEGIYFEIGNRGYIGLGNDTAPTYRYMDDLWEYGPDEKGTSVNELNGPEAGININPCISGGIFYFTLMDSFKKNSLLVIYDSRGTKIKNLSGKELLSSSSIDLSSFAPGMYIYQLTAGNAILKSGKLLIQR